jgi:peptide/nickel transport system substrate-binding protein
LGESGTLSKICEQKESCANTRAKTSSFECLVFRILPAAAIVIALLVTAVPAKVITDTAAASESTLKWGMIEPIDSLNPFIGVNDNSYIFYGLVYDYLVAVDEDMHPKPNLATSWYIVPDITPYGSVWQYNLTHDATWHDGEPFSADDVVFTMNYQTGLNYDSMWAYQPYTILIDHAEKVDEYTARIHFKDTAGNPAPCPFGDKLMMPIVPEHLWRDISASDAGFSFMNYLPIGTGPFMCTTNTRAEYISGSSLVLIKNPNYHGVADYGEEIKFDRLILEFYLEPSAMLTAMETGAIDVAQFNAPNYESLMDYRAQHPNAPIGTYAGLTCTAYSIDLEVNMKSGGGEGSNPLRLDPAVRQAMAYSTDKSFIKDHIYKGYADIGSAILTPIYGDLYWAPGEDDVYNFDMAKANATLDAAGYAWNSDHTKRYANATNPFNPNAQLKFNIIIEAELVEDRDTAYFLKDEWAKVGIDLEPTVVSTGQWNTIVYGYAYDLTISYWSGDPDPNYLLFIQTTYSINGWSENSYSNENYDDNYTISVESVDPVVRREAMLNCQKIMYKDCAFMVTVYPYGCYAWRTDHYTGWGDWEAHRGRSLSNFWTASPLYFDLTPVPHGSGSLTLVLVGLGIAAVVAVVVAIFLRKRGPREDDVRLP